jgi:peroxiredoxin
MNNRFLVALTALFLPLLNTHYVYSAETNAMATAPDAIESKTPPSPAIADLNELVTRINDKLQHDKNTEADLAENLKEFDPLVARHKDAKPEDLARILAMKAQLYLEVLNNPEKALAVFKQIKSDYPATQINGNTDDVIAMLQGMIDRKNIREALAPGKPFPDFNENDVAGNPLSISKYKGKVVLVDFWATWCVPCIVKLPEIQKAYDTFHGQGFEVIGVSLDDEKDKLESFIKQKKMPWPEFFDGKRWENKLAQKYGVDQTPTAYLLDRDGKIIAKLSGDEDLNSEIAQALKK